MTSFASINQPGSVNYRAGWQRQHIIPTELLSRPSLQTFFTNIHNYTEYDNNDFDYNGILLPSKEEIARAEGFAMHRGSHPKYTDFVDRILREVFAEAQSNTLVFGDINLAYQEALRVLRGVQAFLMDGHVASTIITNDLTGEANARPLFMLNRKDPWLPDDSNLALDAALDAVFNSISLASIRTTDVFVEGYFESFEGFGVRSDTIYDPYFKNADGEYASGIQRFLANATGQGLTAINQFTNLDLARVFGDTSDAFRAEAAVLGNVAYFFSGADPDQTIAQITSNIGPALDVPGE